MKKKEEGPLKESVPEICVEKVPSVEYQTLRSAPGLMLSPQKSTSESPYLQSDQVLVLFLQLLGFVGLADLFKLNKNNCDLVGTAELECSSKSHCLANT